MLVPVLLLAFSCARRMDRQGDDLCVDRLHGQKLAFEDLGLDMLLGEPARLHLLDTLLFVVDYARNPVLEIYDLNTKKPCTHGIYTGNGPNELLCPIDTYLTETDLCILERQTDKYKLFPLDGIRKGSLVCAKTIRLPSITDRAIRMDSVYLSCGIYDDGMICFNDDRGETLRSFSPCSEFIGKVADKHLRYRLGQGFLAYHDGILLYMTFFTGEIKLFDLKSGSPELIRHLTIEKENLLEKVRDRAERNDFAVYKEDWMGCREICATNKCFYVSFTRTPYDRNRKEPYYILKFDYAGELQACYRSDFSLSCFAVDAADEYVYAVIANPEEEYVLARAKL